MPIFAISPRKLLLIVNSVNSGVSGPNATKIVYNVEQFILLNLLKIRIAILQSVFEWQHDKVDWSGKNADFSTLIGSMATSIEK